MIVLVPIDLRTEKARTHTHVHARMYARTMIIKNECLIQLSYRGMGYGFTNYAIDQNFIIIDLLDCIDMST